MGRTALSRARKKKKIVEGALNVVFEMKKTDEGEGYLQAEGGG